MAQPVLGLGGFSFVVHLVVLALSGIHRRLMTIYNRITRR